MRSIDSETCRSLNHLFSRLRQQLGEHFERRKNVPDGLEDNDPDKSRERFDKITVRGLVTEPSYVPYSTSFNQNPRRAEGPIGGVLFAAYVPMAVRVQ